MAVKLLFLVAVDRVWGYGRKININAIAGQDLVALNWRWPLLGDDRIEESLTVLLKEIMLLQTGQWLVRR